MREYLKYMVIFLSLFITACDEEDPEIPVVPDGLTVTGDYSNFVTIEVEIEVEDTDDHDHDDDHSALSGFQLWEENMTAATYSQTGLEVSGEITLAVGETKEYVVMFLDDDHGGEEHCEDITTESECGTHTECEWHADDMACEDAGDDHDHGDEEHEEGAGHISITGVSTGTTSFQVQLMHNGHADYTSLPINVTVTTSAN